MKRNDLVETMGTAVDYVSHHRRGVTEGIIAAAVVALLIGGFLLLRTFRENQAGNELSEALAALDRPIAGQPAAAGAVKTFPTLEARSKEVDAHLRKAADHPGTSAGRAAALILAAREKPANAGETFARTARVAKAEVAASAELDAARLLASQGKKTEAIDRLKRAIESPASAAPKDALLFALGQVYEDSGSASDARATFQRLITDYPNSPYRTEARQKIPGS